MANYIWDFNAPKGQRLSVRDSYINKNDILRKQGDYLIATALAEKERQTKVAEQLAQQDVVAPSGTDNVVKLGKIDERLGAQSQVDVPKVNLRGSDLLGGIGVAKRRGEDNPVMSKIYDITDTIAESKPFKAIDIASNAATNAATFGLFNKLYDVAGIDRPQAETGLEKGIEMGAGLVGGIAGTGKLLKGLGVAKTKAIDPVIDVAKGIAKKTPVPVKALAGLGAGVTALETGRGAFDPDYAEQKDTLPSQLGATLRGSTGNLLETLGYSAERHDYTDLSNRLKSAGQKIAKGYEVKPVEGGLTLSNVVNPDWWVNNVASSIPAMAMLIPLGIGGYVVGKGAMSKLGSSKFAQTVVGSLLGAGTSRPLESELEAGGTFQDTGSKKAAQQVFNDNMKLIVLDMFQLGIAMTPAEQMAGKLLGKGTAQASKFMFEAGTEALEEGYQGASQAQASGQDTRSKLAQITSPTPELKEAMFIGGIYGTAMTAAGMVNDMMSNIKARTVAELPDEVMPQVQSRVEELVNQGAEPAEAIDQVLDEMAEVPEVAEVVSRITQEEAEKTVENIAQIQPAATNQKVQDKKGNIFDVVDDSNPEFVVVKDSKGKTKMINRGEAKDLEAGQPQAGEIGADSATVPEPEQNAPQAQGEANAVNVTESGVLEPVNIVADDIEGDIEPTQPTNDINVATEDAAGETQADNVDVTKLPDHVLEDIISKADQVTDKPGNKELLDKVKAEHEKRGLGKTEKETEQKPEKKPTPDRKLKIQRGKHGAVDVTFPDSVHADLFSFNGRLQRHIKGEKKFDVAHEIKRLALSLGLPEDALNKGDVPGQYKAAVMKLISGLPEGASYEAPRLSDLPDIIAEKEPESKPDDSPEQEPVDMDALKAYAEEVVKSGEVEAVYLIGSTAAKGSGNDIDILYQLKDQELPESEEDATEEIEAIVESLDMELDLYDTFIQVGERYFHLSSGAGRGFVENNDYANENKDKPKVLLARAEKAESHNQHIEETPEEPEKEPTVKEVGEFTITKTKHTKTGADMWVVRLKDDKQLPTDEFKKLAARIKALGGSRWSKFSKGFNFYEDPTEKLQPKTEVKKGDKVYDKDGNELTVVNPGNENTMRVRDKDGNQQVIKKAEVKGERPADQSDSVPSWTMPIHNARDEKRIPKAPFRIEQTEQGGWVVYDAKDIGWISSISKEYAQKQMDELSKEYGEEVKAKEGNAFAPAAPIKNKDRSREWLDKMEQDAKDRINSRKGRLLAGLPMDDMLDYSIIGMVKIARTGMDLATFTKEMIDEYGPVLKNWIAGIYAQSQAMLEMTENDLNQMIADSRQDINHPTNQEEKGVESKQEVPKSKEGAEDARPDKQVLESGDEEGVADGRLPVGTDVDSISNPEREGSGISGQNDRPVAGEAPVQQGESGDTSPTADIRKTNQGKSADKEREGTADGTDDSQERQRGRNGKDAGRDTAGSNTVPGAEGSTGTSSEADKTEDNQKVGYGNYRITEENPVFLKGGKKTRYRANIAALKLLDQILTDKRAATIDEQKTLAMYSGWGALPEVFDYEYDRGRGETPKYKDWADEFNEVKELLNDIEEKHFSGEYAYNYRGGLYANARASITNAHYTHPDIIDGIYQALRQMGFKKGLLLEPSMGTGNFFGMLPNEYVGKTKLYGVELDPLTGKIAQLLYPDTDIRIQGFQDTIYPDNLFDAAVGNVPFGDFGVNDKSMPHFLTAKIHNYFFARSIDKVKPGGIIAYITSTGTMDAKGNERVRNYLSQKANLIGAIRLPGDAFKGNAGTEVTTDIIFLQKLKPGELPDNTQWTQAVDYEIDGQTYSLNQYFKAHPDMVLGDLVADKLHNTRLGVQSIYNDIGEALSDTITRNLPANIFDVRITKSETVVSQEEAGMVAEMLEGGISLKDGKLYRKVNTRAVQITENVIQIKHLVELRDLSKEVLSMQRNPEIAEAALEAKRKQMKGKYDSYVKKYGNLLKRGMRNGKLSGRSHVDNVLGYTREIKTKDQRGKEKKVSVFTTEPESYLLKSLEIEKVVADDEGNIKQTFKPSRILTQRTYKVAQPVDKVKTAADGLIASINELGYVDMDRICEIYNKSETEVIAELGDKVFHNPLTGWETADEYLSGNVKKKLKEAQGRLEFEPQYQRNIEALLPIIPSDKTLEDIAVNLGDGWVPFEVTEKVVRHILGFGRRYGDENAIKLQYNPNDNTWNLSKGSKYHNTAEMSALSAGIPKDTLAIIKIALNNSNTIITQTDSEGKIHVNQEATNALKSKVKEIRDSLKDYLSTDIEAAEMVEQVYNDKFNAIVPRDFAEVANTFEFINMNPDIELRPHQKVAITRALLGGNTLLAHGVGAGKTYEQIAIAMESKRLGLANKPLLVVPNTKLGDFENDAKKLYPGAKVLALSQEDFEGTSIKRTLALAAMNDWDMVIIRHSSFSKIPVSPDTEIPALLEEIQELELALAEMDDDSRYTRKQMESRLEKLRLKLAGYSENRVKYEGLINFEDMGFDMLLVDEAHEFKNYPLGGRAASIKGLSGGEADKARDMMIKSSYIRKLNGGKRGVVFGTGTPLSNTMAEVYVMFKYLRPDILQEAGINNFDAWADAFTDIREVAEVSAKGQFRNKKQFKAFVNLPELMTMFKEFTDIKMQDSLNLPLPKHEIIKVECPAHPLLEGIMKRVDSEWQQAIKERKLFRLLNIISNAPQDIRLVVKDADNHKGSKINKIADNVMEIYKKTAKEKGTQLVFATTGESSLTGFSLWDEMRDRLIAKGMPANEIAFIKTGTQEEELEEIYRKINAGKIRVAIGSFAKMGVGINVQERLFALHELNAPYRPADIEQAEGRMIRQGNTYYGSEEKVKVYRYVTVGEEGTFSGDAWRWQIVEGKVKAINAVMKGDPNARTLEAFDEDAQDAAVMKAIALGDERWIRKIELEGEIAQLRSAFNAFRAGQSRAKREMSIAQDKIYSNERDVRYLQGAIREIDSLNDRQEQKKQQQIKERDAELALHPDDEKQIVKEAPLTDFEAQRIKVGDKIFSLADKEGKKAADYALREIIAGYEAKPKVDASTKVGEIYGLELHYTQQFNKGFSSINQGFSLFLNRNTKLLDVGKRYVKLSKGSQDVSYASDEKSVLADALKLIKNFQQRVDKAEKENEILANEISKYQELLSKSFKKEAELQEKQDELKEIDRALGVDTMDVTLSEGENVSDNGSPKFKFADDVAELNEALGADKFNLKYAPEAMEREDMQAAGIIANLLTQSQLIPMKGQDAPQGAAYGNNVFVSVETKDPHLYVAMHEIEHTLEDVDPEAHDEFMAIAKKYFNGAVGMSDYYFRHGYSYKDIWKEFTADVTAEIMQQPGFWAKVREQSPALIKKIVDIIDQIITKFRKEVAKDSSMLQYISDIEAFRDEVAGATAKLLKKKPRNLLDLRGAEAFAAKMKQESSNNVGYHAGDLGKSEHLGRQMGSSRGTGHFGTGTYFVGNPEKLGYDTYQKRPQHKVGFDGYNLYRPDNFEQGLKLHDALRFLNRDYLSAQRKAMSEREIDNLRYGDPEDMIAAMKKYGYWDEEQFREWHGMTSDHFIKNEVEDRKIWDDIKHRADTARRSNERVERAHSYQREFEFDAIILFGITPARAKALAAEVYQEIDKDSGGKRTMMSPEADKSDSASTRFMKKLGYEGVDVRHIPRMDNIEYGSVIYDLKGSANNAQSTASQKGVPFLGIGTLADFVAESLKPKARLLSGIGDKSSAPKIKSGIAPIFYSQLERTIQAKMPNAASQDQVLAIIKGGQVKAEEIAWSGIQEWLREQGSKVSKDDVLNFLKSNEVQIEEISSLDSEQPLSLYDENGDLVAYVERNEDGDGWIVATTDGEYQEEYDFYNPARQDLLNEQERIGGTIEGLKQGISKFAQFQLPGGENYTELLLTLPEIQNKYQSGHWDEPNVLAHVRFNTRTGPNGEKVLFVEEVQSDWHQAGRKKGYKNSKWEVFDPATGEVKHRVNSEEEAKKIIDKHPGYDYEGPDTNLNDNVPNAPFKKSWQELVLKRMIRYAAENGYDRMAWTTGEQQAERYDLSKEIGSVSYNEKTGLLRAYKPPENEMAYNGGLAFEKTGIKKEALADYIGKEPALKLLETPESQSGTKMISGLDLKVGGEGMKTFYDKMLPSFLNKYVKKWGSKVEPIEKVEREYNEQVPFGENEIAGNPSIPITDAMRKSVLAEGQPMFKYSDDVSEMAASLKAYQGIEPAPEAMKTQAFQAADILVRLLTGGRLVPIKGVDAPQGVQRGPNIFVNKKTRDPVLYVAKHEIFHQLDLADPEAFEELLDIAKKYFDNHGGTGMSDYYLNHGYNIEDIWEEFTADVTSEVMELPGFWDKVRSESPKLIQKIVDILDKIIAAFKQEVSEKESKLKYISNLEAFRDEVAGVVAKSLARQPHDISDVRMGKEFAAKTRAKQKQADAKPQYSVRKKAPPKKTIKAYKLMRIDKQGRLYPLFVDRTVETPQGVWLDAKEGKMITTKTGGQKVKSSLGGLAYRPGWHLGDIPLATHIGVKGSSGNIEYMNPDHVWVECEVAADHNYQDQANANGINPKTGRLNKARADLKKIPVDGFYRFKTNPNMTGEWIITGAMKINRILGDEEAARLVRDAGYEPLPRKPKEPAQKQNKPSKAPAKGASLLDGIGGKPKLKRSEPQGPRLTLPDSEVQERMEASRGLKPETLKEKLKAALADIARKGHREFEWLPRTRQFSELRNALLKLRKQKGVAADETLRILDDVTKNLNEYEYDIFTYKVIFDDLAHEFAETRLLPFGLTEENFERNKTAIDQEAENNPKVMEAIEKRRQAWQSIKDKYVKAQKAVGFKVEDKLKKQDYYRHQVLEYANAKGMIGSGKKLRTPAGRGFLKKRVGSTFDINTDYLQAEFEVMAQMLYDTEIAGVVRVVKEHYDVVDQLKRQAIEQNDAGMMEYFRDIIEKYDMDTDPEKLYRKLLNKKQAIAFSQLYKMAARGELPNDNGKYDRIIEAMAEADQTGQVEDEMQGQMFRYLNYLTGQMESEDAQIKARTVYKGMAEKQRMIKNTLGQAYVTWADLIPEGYSLWQPRDGHMFYMASSIPEGIAEELAAGIAQHVGIDASMVRKVMVVGRNYPELVVPEEVALTLENLYKNIGDGPLKKWYEGYRKVYRSWKQWQLISPRRFFRYNIRNVTGDLDALLAGNAKALKKTPQAWKELWQAFFAKDHTYTPELYEWFKRGGFETLMQAQEINDINRNRQFRHLMESRMKQTTWERILKSPATGWNKYWDGVRASTDFREALLRYACYLDYLEQMQSNNGVPKNWGASNQDEIMGLSDVRDRAAKMANELLGAYDEVSVIGTALADNLMPFWRWNEVNFVRYSKLIRNSYRDGKLMATIAGQATGITIRSPFIAWKVGTFVLKASFLLAMLNVWNMMFFRDEEDELSDDVKERAHIILGRNKDGTIRYFSRLGALQDFVDWFGLDTPVQTVTNFLNGRKTLKETAIDIAKQDANKLISALTPFFKNTGEILVGWKLFPDAFDPIRIRDRWEYLFDSFGLKSEYRAATGKPTKGYLRSLPDVFYYTSDPYETAYFANKENISRFKKKIGKDSTGYSESKRSDALYNLKMAMRYQDRDAMEKYLLEYVALGGTSKGLKQSLKTMSPLYGLNDVEKQAYVAQLDAEGRTELAKAIEYYLRVIDPQGQSQSEDQE